MVNLRGRGITVELEQSWFPSIILKEGTTCTEIFKIVSPQLIVKSV